MSFGVWLFDFTKGESLFCGGVLWTKALVRNAAAIRSRAEIDLDGGISCLVINLSDSEVAIPFSLPIEFEIAIEGESKKRYGAIAW